MSAVKSKFAGLLRGLLRHFDDNEPVEPVVAIEPVAATPAAKTFGSAAPVVPTVAAAEPAAARPSLRPPTPAYAPAYVPQRGSAAPAKAVEIKQQGIELPLQPIIAALPLELRAKITGSGAAGTTISIPVEKVLTQLATGSVKISFGELRQMAPGTFANYGGEHDARSVALPLNQVIAQINPALLARRAAQKQVEISDDIASPFDAPGSGLKISTEKAKATPPPMPAAEPLPLSRFAPPVSQTPVQPPPVAPPPAFVPRWTTPATSSSSGNGGNTWQKNVPAKDANGSSSARPAGFDAAQPAAAAAPKAASTPSAAVEPPLLVTLAVIFEGWPDALKLEISQLDLENAQVALPVNLVEPALKRGRVVFAWRNLRSWIRSAAVAVSVHDGTELELPLKVLAPLFFARQKGGATGPKKVSVTEEIPDLFFGSTPPPPPAPAPVAPPAPAPAAVAAAIPPPDTNYFTRSIQPPTSDSEFMRKGGTDFKSRSTAPADIVARAMELPGVAGALITLSDGLKVASQVPAELNGDTLAAFIPQIFARVSQGSRELRMGELNNLSFTVGNVAWKIFRVNAIYFAAFGRKNEPLPGASLAALAVQLDHKK
jgi:predicted regulator of Ras-like GTPase activity (Roadblock/LC7/MglB family)